TNQGQTILVFLGITTLLIPILAQVIAPIAFVIAVVYAIDKLNGDSEIVVMNAAGISPARLFRPFLYAGVVVSVLVAFVSAFLAEQGSIFRKDGGTFLLLQNGSIQRLEKGPAEPRIVLFDRYAFDLSRFTNEAPAAQVKNRPPRERYLWELMAPDPDDAALK